jgi:hypothetical protein
MTLSQKHLQEVCMMNCGSRTCRYLYNDELNPNIWHCNKLKPIEKLKIDKRVNEHYRDKKSKKTMPEGDNCSGFLVLKNIKQGYDCE